MQDTPPHRFAPRWVVLIYMMSIVEAIGLAVYFSAGVTDPEMASMQPLYTASQEASSTVMAQPACPECLLVARSRQHVSIDRAHADRNASGRQRESR
jgi:hypothetical protein